MPRSPSTPQDTIGGMIENLLLTDDCLLETGEGRQPA
jgi:hypothetical protein